MEDIFNIKVKVKGSSRSDIALLLSGWRGELEIHEERLQEIFADYLK